MKQFIQGFSVGGFVAVLAGLIGLGGAEFRLPLLIAVFKLDILKAIILNKATSLVVVIFALFFRTSEIPFEELFEYKMIIFNLLLGSLVGAWFSAGIVTKIDKDLLKDIVFMLLLIIAIVLVFEHFL